MAYNQTTGITSDSPDGGAFDERSSSSITSTNQAKDILDAAALQAALSAESATDSAASATAAGISESNASISEVNSASDVISAANSATESAESAADALLSENAASNSETNSTNSATAASISEGNSANSAISAATSATASANSATNSSNSATTSATNATNSANSATTSASSATNAASSASSAQTAQTAAETAETNAAILASNAASSASNAASSETNAAYSALASSTSATNSASSASTSASNASGASTSATNAGTSETNAATSASASANSASNAASSAASAASALDSFDDRYLGAKSSAPTLDNDGDALVAGALYYDTTETGMFVYDGSQWLVASSATQAILTVYNYTATSGQTTFSGVDDNTATLTYVSGSIIVTLNGIFLEDNADYTATSGTSVTLTTGANSNDELNVYAYNTFDSVNVYALGDTRYFQLSSTNEDISVNSITATGGTINGTSVGASTPSTGAFTSLSTSGVNNLAGLTASTALALDVSKNVVSVANTGTGSNVLNTSPTLVTPALGTPASGIMTNVTGTATALNIGGNAATATNASTVTTNADLTGAVTSVGNAASLGSFTSAQLATALTDETGTGANVFAISPTLVTPALGTPSSGVVTNLTGTASININGTVGATTASTGAFTSLSASGAISASTTLNVTGASTLTGGVVGNVTFEQTSGVANENLYVKGFGAGGLGGVTVYRNDGAGTQNIAGVFAGGVPIAGIGGLVISTTSTANPALGFFTPNTTGGHIVFSPKGVEKVRIDSAGNVGIGTTSPAGKLDVAGSLGNVSVSAAGVQLDFSRAGSNYIRATNATGELRFGTGANSDRMVLNSSGNLGLGVTPSAWGGSYRAQDIGGVIGITSSVNGDIWYNAYNNGTSSIYKNGGYKASLFRQNNGAFEWHNTNATGTAGAAISFTQAMTLDASGNLGIGTTSPGAYKLNVAGNVNVTGASTLAAVTAVGRVEISGGSGDRIFQVSGTSATTGTTQFGEVFNPTFGAAVTTLYGRYIGFTSNGATGTNAYSMYVEPVGGTSTFTNKWGLYITGTDKNHLNGPVTMGNGLAVTGAISATEIISANKGITFPATQVASADANTLDDYEEGTWTPSVGGTATYSIQLGRYTKIGNIVHLEFMLTSNGGAGASNAITGLPFSAGTTMRWAASIANVHGVQFNGTSPTGEAFNSSLYFYGFSNNATSGTADFTTFTNVNILNGSCSYRVA